jgi:hypothetical protein
MTETVVAHRNTVYVDGFANPLTLPANAEAASHIKVYADDQLLTQGTDYNLDGVGDVGDLDEIVGVEATIEDVPAWAAYETFTIIHEPPLDQDYALGTGFAAVFERALDAVVRRLQSVGSLLARALHLPPGVTGVSTQLPRPEPRRALIWNETGTGLLNSYADPDTDGLVDASVAAAAAEAALAAAKIVLAAAELARDEAEAAQAAAEAAAASAGDPEAIAALALPVGSTILYAGTSAPAGYLKENGAAVSRTTYAALFDAISTAFGAGDGSTTFNLPESRGEFFRALDDSRGVDSGRTIASAQSEMIGPHGHTASSDSAGAHTHAVGVYDGVGAGSRVLRGTGTRTSQQNTDSGGSHSHTITVNNNSGTENRPRNVARLACIKYLNYVPPE